MKLQISFLLHRRFDLVKIGADEAAREGEFFL
jgi:hypothetical protein